MRTSGILLHITSLPSAYGVGDLGPAAYDFVDFLEDAGQAYWQVLPLNPTAAGSGFSPYSGLSAFAGNPLLLSPERLCTDGYLDEADLSERPSRAGRADYEGAVARKEALFDKAYERFAATRPPADYVGFCEEHAAWLDDYALFVALQAEHGADWGAWPEPLRHRQPAALDRARRAGADALGREKFLQYQFFRQWESLHRYAHRRGVRLFGDMPIYLGYHSADVWAHPEYFKLDEDRRSVAVAGVPPDYFSATGQLWGMPVFDWERLRENGYDWWLDRLAHNLRLFDLLRLDHFRALSAYWEVPATAETAIDGTWQPGPGAPFLEAVRGRLPNLPLVAEDLGEIDQPVYDLMAQFGLPGMRVLQFAWGPGVGGNPHAPHQHVPNSLVYTGTHDNNTTRGWFKDELSAADRARLADYIDARPTADTISRTMIRLAMMSPARLAVIPAQDVLDLGSAAFMNKPAVPKGNWRWQLRPGQLAPRHAEALRALAERYGRQVPPVPKKSDEA